MMPLVPATRRPPPSSPSPAASTSIAISDEKPSSLDLSACRPPPTHPFTTRRVTSCLPACHVVHLSKRPEAEPHARRRPAHLWTGRECPHAPSALARPRSWKFTTTDDSCPHPCPCPLLRLPQVRDANVVAALSIANVVKSSLGPVGLDKSEQICLRHTPAQLLEY